MTNDEYKAKCQWLSEFYAEAAKTGRQMQMRIANLNWITNSTGPDAGCDASDWRLKPEPQKFWIVWEPNGHPSVILGENLAKNHARLSGGTIQEITKPD